MAYRLIRESIVKGRLAQGERLVEMRLAEDLGVSKAPIREALKRLRDERLVAERPRYGTFVRTLTEKDFVDIYNMRLAVEGLAVRLVVRTRASLEALEVLARDMRRAAESGEVEKLADTDVRFHEELCAAADNEYLDDAFRSLSGPIRMALALDNEVYGELSEIVEEHTALLDAMRSREEEKAVAAVQSHILNAATKRGHRPDELLGPIGSRRSS
jgi:DNA-binding GntR family transcriptional regulator